MSDPLVYPTTDPRHWWAKRTERRRRRVFTRVPQATDTPEVQGYLWRVIPAATGRAVTDPIDAERHRLADYLSAKHPRTVAGMLGAPDDHDNPQALVRHMLTLDLYALRMLLVDAAAAYGPTMGDRRRAARARELEHTQITTVAERLNDTGDVTRDYLIRAGVLHKVERMAHSDGTGQPVVIEVTRPVLNAWTTWCGKTWRAAHIIRALRYSWARTPEGRVLTTSDIRARVNPNCPRLGGSRSFKHTQEIV